MDFSSIPTDLPPRYQIRRLDDSHKDWATAIIFHSNMFYSPVWPVLYPEDKCGRLYRGFEHGDYLIDHQIKSGHSFGVFDTEYKFKRPESAATNGKLYWDPKNPSKDETGQELLDQMDFPLVSVAMAYDGFDALDMEKMGPLIMCLPAFVDIYTGLVSRDQRPPESWKPTAHKQVLMRNATSSRHDIEGKQIMKKLAYFLMRYADSVGFRGIQIECAHDKVNWVWTHPPEPFQSTTVSEFNSWEIETEEEVDGQKTGKKIKTFGDARQRLTKVYVDLKPNQK